MNLRAMDAVEYIVLQHQTFANEILLEYLPLNRTQILFAGIVRLLPGEHKVDRTHSVGQVQGFRLDFGRVYAVVRGNAVHFDGVVRTVFTGEAEEREVRD